MTTRYTSLELSQLIHAAVPEVETVAWHEIHENGQYLGMANTRYKKSVTHAVDYFPAYRLDNVLECIKAWGEKNGYNESKWKCVNYNEKANEIGERGCASPYCSYAGWQDIKELSHNLLTTYLEEEGFGPKCERIIRSIFKI